MRLRPRAGDAAGRQRSGFLLAAVAASALLAGCVNPDRRYPIAADSGFEALDLVVENGGTAPLRCTLILAHFITKEIGEIAPGGRVSVPLERRSGDGVLASGRHKGEPMLVENVLCGSVADWQATAGDLPLPAIRRGSKRHYRLRCRIAERLACAFEEGAARTTPAS
ncbi:MAG: hypothetical protein RH942_00975 [Kiloniellaceae bacterium]